MARLPKALIRKYGISKKAWSIFKRSKSSGTRTRKVTKAKTMARKRSYRSYPRRAYRRARTGFAGLGKGLSIKNLAVGAAALTIAKMFQPFGGNYKPAVDKIACGVILPAIKMDNNDLLTAGIKEGIATLVTGYLSGAGYSGGSL